VAVSAVRHITAGLIYYQIFCCSALANKEENIDYGHVWACPSITPSEKVLLFVGWGTGPHLIMVSWAPQVHILNSISISSSVFAELTVMTS